MYYPSPRKDIIMINYNHFVDIITKLKTKGYTYKYDLTLFENFEFTKECDDGYRIYFTYIRVMLNYKGLEVISIVDESKNNINKLRKLKLIELYDKY